MNIADLSSLDTTTIDSLNTISGPIYTIFLIVTVMVATIIIISLYRIFVKAGRPGWAAIIPIYNMYLLLKVIKKPGWWIILFFIPIVTYIIQIIVAIEIGKAFGKSALFSTIFLLLLPVGFLVIAFDKSKYQYTEAEKASVANPTCCKYSNSSSKFFCLKF